jgi:hypothetical protein
MSEIPSTQVPSFDIQLFNNHFIDPRTPTLNPKGLPSAPVAAALISENPIFPIIQK